MAGLTGSRRVPRRATTGNRHRFGVYYVLIGMFLRVWSLRSHHQDVREEQSEVYQGFMYEQVNDPDTSILCDGLLQEWYAKRVAVDSYYRALRFLMLESGVVTPRQHELWRELNDRLETALIAHRHSSDQLDSCEREAVVAAVVR